ncbi:MAG: NUDIX hydrolase [Planctomycetota bacterium]|nr:NUDIX hydrolase [Planctomycetota bacterium]
MTPLEPEPFTPFQRVRSERIYDSPWVGLRRDVVRRGDGPEREYHVVEITDAVAVVPVRSDGSIVLVGQYRYPHGRTHWEVPAGRLSAGESAIDAARRELAEETGHVAARFEPLPGFYPINGISAHWAHLYVAHDCAATGVQALDELEQIVVRTFTRAEVEALLDAGRFADGFTALALLQYLRRAASR